ncbi:MAG: hypothetical protein WBF33_09390 [Candidatus Nitrosopolaris sp.]
MISNLNLEDTTYRVFYNRFDEDSTDINNRDAVPRKMHFVICESCYVVASIIQNDKGVKKCPVYGCRSKIEILEIMGLR